jgi:hypothetical protein
MEFGVARKSGIVQVVATHTSGPDDTTSLQLISAGLLAYYQHLERAMRVFLTQSQIDAIRASCVTTPLPSQGQQQPPGISPSQ